MSKLTVKMIGAAGVILLACGSPLLMAAENPGNAENLAEPVLQICDEEVDAEAQTPIGSASEGKPIPAPSCLSSQPLTCDQMPIGVGDTCSCTSTLQSFKCKSCDGGKGQVLSTTCTVYSVCTSPPCDIQQNYSRTGLSCAT